MKTQIHLIKSWMLFRLPKESEEDKTKRAESNSGGNKTYSHSF